MRLFADELRAGIGEAARKMAEARLAGDDYGAEAYRERLFHLRRVARCHGLFPCAGQAGEPGDGRPGEGAGGRRRG
jgi:hypothetical protein